MTHLNKCLLSEQSQSSIALILGDGRSLEPKTVESRNVGDTSVRQTQVRYE